MDLQNALLTVAAVVAVTGFVKRLFAQVGLTVEGAWAQLASYGISLGVLFLAASSFWASQEVIGGQQLDKLSVSDIFFAAIFVAGAANVGNKVIEALPNFGANKDKPESV